MNGAGKTTTFKMLTGDIVPSAGDAVIAGHTLSTSRGPVQQSIGYCPQVDALIDQLTGRQHLVLFCRLRGLRGTDLQGVVEEALEKLGLNAYADRPVGAYSGGNRRKLSTAIALLANPPLVLLDEPTSGQCMCTSEHTVYASIRNTRTSTMIQYMFVATAYAPHTPHTSHLTHHPLQELILVPATSYGLSFVD